MKKLLIFVLSLSASNIFAELAYNPKTGKYYSKNAAKNVNQEKYHTLFFHMLNGNLGDNPSMVFAQLRIIGSPEAIRLIHDIKQLRKDTIKDLKEFYGP